MGYPALVLGRMLFFYRRAISWIGDNYDISTAAYQKDPITHLLSLLLVFLLIGLNGCNRLFPLQYSADKVLHGSLGGHPIDHVVIFAVDGLEQDTLVKYLMQNPPRKPGGLHDLLGVRVDASGLRLTKGIAVQQPTTVFPSYTYPAWTSMFTGVFPGAHGIAGNSLFFRERQVARYYTEYHMDAVKVQLAEGLPLRRYQRSGENDLRVYRTAWRAEPRRAPHAHAREWAGGD